MFNELKSFHLKKRNKKGIITVMMSHFKLPYALIEFRLCECVWASRVVIHLGEFHSQMTFNLN